MKDGDVDLRPRLYGQLHHELTDTDIEQIGMCSRLHGIVFKCQIGVCACRSCPSHSVTGFGVKEFGLEPRNGNERETTTAMLIFMFGVESGSLSRGL